LNSKVLVQSDFLLQKFPGKGGWTYIALEIETNKKAWFGWRTVNGNIDDYQLGDCKLMPIGNGKLFLPVKAEIRKQLGKQAGDTVHLVLYTADPPSPVEDDLLLCLSDEPAAKKAFDFLSEKEKTALRKWVFETGRDQETVDRMGQVISRLAEGRLWNKD